MKGLIGSAILFASLMTSSSLVHAQSIPPSCAGAQSGIGNSSSSEGGLELERSEGQVPPGLARQRAIENWQHQIASTCPRYSTKWWRARAARIECEGGRGKESCRATAQPARKLLSYLMSY